MEPSRVPPHDRDVEGALLGALLLDSQNKVAPLVIGLLQQQDFYIGAHGLIFAAIAKLAAAGDRVDVVTVGTLLKDEERIKEVGGMTYLTELLNAGFVPDHIESYAKRLRELRAVRETIAHAQMVAAQGYVLSTDPDAVKDYLGKVPKKFTDIATSIYQRCKPKMAMDLIKEYLAKLMKRADDGTPLGQHTGFAPLDECTGGLRKGSLYIVAARPSVGKSTFALNVAANIAASVGVRRDPTSDPYVLFFSLEMGEDEISEKLVTYLTEENVQEFTSRANPRSFQKAFSVMNDAQGPRCLDVRAEAKHSPATIRADIIQAQAQLAQSGHRSISLVVVDYLLLLQNDRNYENRAVEVGALTRALKVIASECQVPMLVLTQLNRSAEKDAKGNRPDLIHLKSSGDIEQDANVVMFLWRPEESTAAVSEPRRVMLTVAKNRQGPTGIDIPFDFYGAQSRFVVAKEDAPPPVKAVPRPPPATYAEDQVGGIYWE